MIIDKSHYNAIAAMRSSGMPLEAIAIEYRVSRERIRQICAAMGIGKPVRAPIWPRGYFHRVMFGWLKAEGIQKCYDCGIWEQGTKWRCRDCNRAQSKAWRLKYPERYKAKRDHFNRLAAEKKRAARQKQPSVILGNYIDDYID